MSSFFVLLQGCFVTLFIFLCLHIASMCQVCYYGTVVVTFALAVCLGVCVCLCVSTCTLSFRAYLYAKRVPMDFLKQFVETTNHLFFWRTLLLLLALRWPVLQDSCRTIHSLGVSARIWYGPRVTGRRASLTGYAPTYLVSLGNSGSR